MHWGVGWVRSAVKALFGNIIWLIEGGMGELGRVKGIFPHTKNTCLLNLCYPAALFSLYFQFVC